MKRLRAAVLVLPVLFVAQSAPALAQDKGDVGISMGYPVSVGVVFHLTDSVALRPEISFTHISSDSDSAFGDITTLTRSASADCYMLDGGTSCERM